MSEPAVVPAPAAAKEPEKAPAPAIHIAPSPHLSGGSLTTQRMMIDVLVALAPAALMAVYNFQWYAVRQIGLCVLACVAFEALFAAMRGRKATLGDGSAAVTGVILAFSLPWSAPWYVAAIGSGVAIGLGKAAFGGLGQNIFNPAMVGRAFVMISFAGALGAGAYVAGDSALQVVTQATPLTAAKKAAGDLPDLWVLFIGTRNGSLGEVSVLACLLGGIYLCLRRTASWEIPAGMLASVAVIGGIANALSGPEPALPILKYTALQHLCSGAVVFGAFFIATDPVSSPLTPRGKALFGVGIGALAMVCRLFSNYPEGVMFAVLVMNALTPLINRWTIPVPLGGLPPAPVAKKA